MPVDRPDVLCAHKRAGVGAGPGCDCKGCLDVGAPLDEDDPAAVRSPFWERDVPCSGDRAHDPSRHVDHDEALLAPGRALDCETRSTGAPRQVAQVPADARSPAAAAPRVHDLNDRPTFHASGECEPATVRRPRVTAELAAGVRRGRRAERRSATRYSSGLLSTCRWSSSSDPSSDQVVSKPEPRARRRLLPVATLVKTTPGLAESSAEVVNTTCLPSGATSGGPRSRTRRSCRPLTVATISASPRMNATRRPRS